MPMTAATRTPRRYIRGAKVVLAITTPLTVLTLVAWGFRLHAPFQMRPYLVLMVYMALLLVTVLAIAVWALASCHLAINQAFSAGLTAGKQVAAAEAQAKHATRRARRARRSDEPARLHAVE